jgi:hypothetical protein
VNEVLARLEAVYRQQLGIYDQVLALARQAAAAARERRSLQELNALLEQKQRHLIEIDRLDQRADEDRRRFRRQGGSPTEASQLRRPLAAAAERIEQILACEREMERCLVAHRRQSDDGLCADAEAGD